MMKKVCASFLVILFSFQEQLFSQTGVATEELPIEYAKPFHYQKLAGQLMTEGIIPYHGSGEKLTVELGNAAIPFKILPGNKLKIQLPLVGEETTLCIKENGRIVTTQLFRPYIPRDWGYFKNGTIDIISSSHQDIAWMNTPDFCRDERIHKIIEPAMDLMKSHANFKFGMEQALNLKELIEEDSSYKSKAIDFYQSGQFAWGATYNQPYEGLESSEQLVRELYLGKKWLRDEFDGKIDAETAYNVDVPARTLQFPQILNKAGVKNLFISRFKEGFYNWYSPDGSHIFTYSPGNYGWAVMFYKYFNEDAPTAMHKLHKVLKNWNQYYSSRDIPPHYAVVISNDAEGPIFYENVLHEWNEIVEASGLEIPKLQYSTTDQFLSSVNVPEARFDSISGERPNLWLYIHGPAHYQAIKAKRESAIHLPASEMFNAIDALLNGSFRAYPEKQLSSAWFKAIYPDHGWGGKNGDITDSIFRSSLEESDSIARQTLNTALNSIANKVKVTAKDPLVVFNDLSWSRTAIGSFELPSGSDFFDVVDGQGYVVPSQHTKNGEVSKIVFLANEVPSIGYKTYYLKKKRAESKVEQLLQSNSYENKFYKVEFGNGGVTRLFDKELKKDLLNTSRFAGGDVMELGYDGNGAGEFTEITPTNMKNFDKLSNHRTIWYIKENGGVFTTFQANYIINNTAITQKITVYHEIKKIDFEYEIPEWEGVKGRQLRFALPLNSESASITYGVPMGVSTVEKSELNRRPGGWAWGGTYRQKPEEIHPREMLDCVSANAENFGITLSTNVSVFDWIDPTVDAVSYPVIQSVMLSTHKSCHGEGPWYLQKGSHSFKFSITSHQNGWEKGYEFGVGSNHEFYVINPKASLKSQNLPSEFCFIQSSSPMTPITAFKKSDNNEIIMRTVNMKDKSGMVEIKLFKEIKTLDKVSLIEAGNNPLPVNEGVVRAPIERHGIETFRVGF